MTYLWTWVDNHERIGKILTNLGRISMSFSLGSLTAWSNDGAKRACDDSLSVDCCRIRVIRLRRPSASNVQQAPRRLCASWAFWTATHARKMRKETRAKRFTNCKSYRKCIEFGSRIVISCWWNRNVEVKLLRL
jgi:hypothetical protein